MFDALARWVHKRARAVLVVAVLGAIVAAVLGFGVAGRADGMALGARERAGESNGFDSEAPGLSWRARFHGAPLAEPYREIRGVDIGRVGDVSRALA